MSIIKLIKVTSKYKNCLVVESLYSLALYVHVKKGKIDDTLFFIGDNVFFPELIDTLSNVIIYDKERMNKIRGLKKLLISHGIYMGEYRRIANYFNCVKSFYGHDHISSSVFFRRNNLVIIEDGLANYGAKETYSLFKRLKKRILYREYGFLGYSKNSKNAYLTGLKELPAEFKAKPNYIDRDVFLRSLPECLNGIFYPKCLQDETSTLLITQPFSEDGYITESEKIQMYKQLIDKHNPSALLIKPHPRERTDYSLIDFNCKKVDILPNYVLAECLYDLNFDKVVTISSTSIYSFNDASTQVCLEGIEFYPTLFNSFNEV